MMSDVEEAAQEEWDKIMIELKEMGPDQIKDHAIPYGRVKKIMKSEDFALQELKRIAEEQQHGKGDNNNKSNTNNDDNKRDCMFMISGECPILMAKACQLMIRDLSIRAWYNTNSTRRKTIQKSDIYHAASENEMYDFLIDIIPRTIPDNSSSSHSNNNNTNTNNNNSHATTFPTTTTTTANSANHPNKNNNSSTIQQGMHVNTYFPTTMIQQPQQQQMVTTTVHGTQMDTTTVPASSVSQITQQDSTITIPQDLQQQQQHSHTNNGHFVTTTATAASIPESIDTTMNLSFSMENIPFSPLQQQQLQQGTLQDMGEKDGQNSSYYQQQQWDLE